ncbi:MAG: DUF4123 domain-containing protein [Gemmataceae bacterium]
MRLTLVVQSGDSTGKRFVAEGAALRVGRVAPAEVCVLDDPMLSASHFCIEAKDGNFIVRDLKSRFGTQVNGMAVVETTLQDGDTITAGRTRFAVEVVGGTVVSRTTVSDPPPMPRERPAAEPQVAPDRNRRIAAALAFLREQRNLHVVLDAARNPAILPLIQKCGLVFESLYDGEKGAEIAAFGPWLVEIPRGGPFLDALVNEGWGDSWGVFLNCHSPFVEIRKQLRRHLLATLPDGREVYFRYYDPRVLRTYLQTCTPTELGGFFGPITQFFAESGDESSLLVYGPTFKHWQRIALDDAMKVPA